MLVIKIGGGDAINFDGIARDLSTVEGPKVIVHGANAVGLTGLDGALVRGMRNKGIRVRIWRAARRRRPGA